MQTLVWHPPRPMNTELDARALTMRIKGCRDWIELKDVCVRHYKLFNSIHLAASITHLAQIQSQSTYSIATNKNLSASSIGYYGEAFQAPGSRRRIRTIHTSKAMILTDRSGSYSLLDQLLKHVLQHQESFSARQLSNMVWAASRLCSDQVGLAPDCNLILFCKAAVQHSLTQRGPSLPQHLSNFAYGFALLRVDPGRHWALSLIHKSLDSIEFFKPCELVILVFALNKILVQHHQLDSALHMGLESLISSVVAATELQTSEFSGKELSSLVLSISSLSRLAKCEAELFKSTWMLRIIKSSEDRIDNGDFNSQSISCTLLAFSRLSKFKPGILHDVQLRSFLNQVTVASQHSLSHWPIYALSSTLASLSSLQFSPSESWMISFEQAVLGHLTRALQESRGVAPTNLAQHLGAIVYGMAKVQWVPALTFTSTFLACCSIVALRDLETNQIILSLKRIGVVCNEISPLHWDRARSKLQKSPLADSTLCANVNGES